MEFKDVVGIITLGCAIFCSIMVGIQSSKSKLIDSATYRINELREDRSKRCVIPKSCIMISDMKVRDNCIAETVYCE